VGLKHELWEDIGGDQFAHFTFCLAGPLGDDARRTLSPHAKLIWTTVANSHFEAMSKYYAFMEWGEYSTDEPWDNEPYPSEWYGLT